MTTLKNVFLFAFTICLFAAGHASGEEWRDNFDEQKEQLRNKYAWVYFGHEEKYENALKYTVQYYTGDWANATKEIASVIAADVEGLAQSMSQHGIDPTRHQISFGRVTIKNEYRVNLGGGNFRVGSTGWNRGLDSYANYVYVTHNNYDRVPDSANDVPPTRNPPPSTPAVISLNHVKCIDSKEVRDDIYTKVFVDGEYIGRYPKDDFNMKAGNSLYLPFSFSNLQFHQSVVFQLWDKDLGDDELMANVVIDRQQYDSGAIPNVISIIGGTEFPNLSDTTFRKYNYQLHLTGAQAGNQQPGVAPLPGTASSGTPAGLDPTGLLLGIRCYNTPRGLAIDDFIEGYGDNTGALAKGDAIQAVTVDGKVVSAMTLDDFRNAKSKVGPENRTVIKIFRPGVGYLYPEVKFSIEGGGGTVYTSAPQFMNSSLESEKYFNSLPVEP
ncbi:MAG: hypothetical protein R3C18_17715 [Planctomycetaceae bacterium]